MQKNIYSFIFKILHRIIGNLKETICFKILHRHVYVREGHYQRYQSILVLYPITIKIEWRWWQ